MSNIDYDWKIRVLAQIAGKSSRPTPARAGELLRKRIWRRQGKMRSTRNWRSSRRLFSFMTSTLSSVVSQKLVQCPEC